MKLPQTAPLLFDYPSVRWNSSWCKRCIICVQVCPTRALELRDDVIRELDGCIHCRMCERFCPDMAIQVREKEKGTS